MRDDRRSIRCGFTLVELLVVVGVIGLLVALLLPAVQSARSAARSTACKSSLRQVGLAIAQHCDLHQGEFPEWSHAGAGRSWIDTLAAHLERVDAVRICPDDPRASERLRARATSYVLSDYLSAEGVPGAVRDRDKLRATGKTITAFEVAGALQADPRYDHAHASQWFSELNLQWGLVRDSVLTDVQPDRHAPGAHYLYVDGHVDFLPRATVDDWIDAGINFALPQ